MIQYLFSYIRKVYSAKKAIKASKSLSTIFETFAKKHIQSEPDKICYSFLIIGLTRYKAIIALCKLGLNNDAKILNRSLFEYFLKMYWIFNNKSKKEARLEQYKKFGDAYHYFLASQVPEIIDSTNEKSKKHLKHLKKIYTEYKHDEFKAPIEPKEMRISQICKEKFNIDGKQQNCKKIYKKPYAFFSTFVHPNAYSHITYFKDYNNNHLKPAFNQDFHDTKRNLYYAGQFLRLMFKLYTQIYKINFENLDKGISRKLNVYLA